ncbi:hypothetical protein GCM10027046_09170 [Uliginosibacterium flavum]|uniref:XrtB/PEP-CTERM-associated transcriptional regulator EpsA n=1 Tax=Uliginosibacterium flavum TaxID=1396831 RepID=A0ABV2TIA6_9RHOO
MQEALAARHAAQTSLNPQELEFFLSAIEGSARIRKRSQFYLWTQGALQSFIPHETLICALGLPGALNVRSELHTRNANDEALTQRLCNGDNSLLNKLARRWMENGYHPLLLRRNDSQLGLLICELGLDSALCHGSQSPESGPGGQRQPGSFFAFLQVPDQSHVRFTYVLELLLPHLHMAFVQMSCTENPEPDTLSINRCIQTCLSSREIEVLHWIRAGKTNFEIGVILDISPLTVKNHVQKILRKLNVSNRAQAAACPGETSEAGNIN